MLLVQEFLLNHTLKELEEQHGVFASFNKTGVKASFNYGMLEAKENDPLAKQCRGLILSASDGRSFLNESEIVNGRPNYKNICMGNTKVLAYPMNRFLNHGQGYCDPINWQDPNLRIMEKLDGTCCILYYSSIEDKWCVATRSCPDADIIMDSGLYTFSDLFKIGLIKTTSLGFDIFTKDLNKDITYIFELTSVYNRIVVNYKETKITLIAARDLTTFKEVDINTLNLVVPCVHTYECMTLNELLYEVSSKNPLEHEGVVVKDSNFYRVKVKNPAYVACHRAKDTLSSSVRNCVELVLSGYDDDIVSSLPEEIVNRISDIKRGLNLLISDYDKKYEEFKSLYDQTGLTDKKTFAMIVIKHKLQNKDFWEAPFFDIFSGKSSNMKDFIMNQRKNGVWGNSFLDKILQQIENYVQIK